MSTWDSRYAERVQLLVDILPYVGREPRFALKGGTAINLFEHDLPRLSVDIDLAWLPVGDFQTDACEITAALQRIAEVLSAPPLRLQLQSTIAAGSASATRVTASRGRSRVQIETTPVMRGTVHPVRRMDARPGVERQFGSASAQVLSFDDLYAGKLTATLSRQHPRDLFDVGMLLDREGLTESLWHTFLVYLTCSPKLASEILSPSEPLGFSSVFASQFRGMTAIPTSVEALLTARQRLLDRIARLLDTRSCEFLLSVEHETPDFALIGLPQAANLPAVLRKMQNLSQRSQSKRLTDHAQLAQTLARLSASRSPG